MLEIGSLQSLRSLRWKVYHLEAEGWKRAGLKLVNRQSNGKGLWLIQP